MGDPDANQCHADPFQSEWNRDLGPDGTDLVVAPWNGECLAAQTHEQRKSGDTNRDPHETSQQQETLHVPVTLLNLLLERRQLDALFDGRQPFTMNHQPPLVSSPHLKDVGRCRRKYQTDDDEAARVLHIFGPPAVDTRDGPWRLHAAQPRFAAVRIKSRMGADVQRLLRERRYDEALEAMLDLYEHKVFRMAVAILRDAGRAEEVTQDIFLKMWRALPAYDGRASLSTWLYAIARNTCLSAVRAESYRKTSALEDVPEPSAASSAPAIDWERLLAKLPDAQRHVITLFYFEERSVTEVAAMLDLPEGTVKSQLHRARRALADMME